MKKVKSFTLNQSTIDLLEGISESSSPHVFQSAIVETAIIDYSQKIKYKGESFETSAEKRNKKTS